MAWLPRYEAITFFLKDVVRSIGMGISKIIFPFVIRFVLVPFRSEFISYHVCFCNNVGSCRAHSFLLVSSIMMCNELLKRHFLVSSFNCYLLSLLDGNSFSIRSYETNSLSIVIFSGLVSSSILWYSLIWILMSLSLIIYKW